MSSENQPGALSAAFPAPPPFYKSFTAENLDRIKQQQQQLASQRRGDYGTETELTVSPDLQNLEPPPLPRDGKYTFFGVEYDAKPPSSSTPSVPTRAALLTLSDRLLRSFLRYVQILGTDPSGLLWVPQWEEIRKTFEEAHAIVNEYRPHQARETLILMMEDQIKHMRDETARIRESVTKARQVLENLGAHNGAVDVKLQGFATEAEEPKKGPQNSMKEVQSAARRILEQVDEEAGIH